MKPVKATTFILVFSLAVWLIYQAASEQDNKDLKVELSAPPTLIKDSNAVDFIVKEEAPKLSLEEPMIDFDFSNPLSYASGSSHCGQNSEQFYDGLLKLQENTAFSEKQANIY